MPHISLGNDAPGIVSLLAYQPETVSSSNDRRAGLLAAGCVPWQWLQTARASRVAGAI
jgi:hypothetical protein